MNKHLNRKYCKQSTRWSVCAAYDELFVTDCAQFFVETMHWWWLQRHEDRFTSYKFDRNQEIHACCLLQNTNSAAKITPKPLTTAISARKDRDEKESGKKKSNPNERQQKHTHTLQKSIRSHNNSNNNINRKTYVNTAGYSHFSFSIGFIVVYVRDTVRKNIVIDKQIHSVLYTFITFKCIFC